MSPPNKDVSAAIIISSNEMVLLIISYRPIVLTHCLIFTLCLSELKLKMCGFGFSIVVRVIVIALLL